MRKQGEGRFDPKQFADFLPDVRARNPPLADELAEFAGVSDLLSWMQQTGRTKSQVAIIAQDEFKYDFLIQLAPAGDWIAFGIT